MAHSPHPTQWQVPECKQRHPWATNPWHLATPDVESLEEQLQQYLGPSQATKKLATTAGEFVYCTDWCRDGCLAQMVQLIKKSVMTMAVAEIA